MKLYIQAAKEIRGHAEKECNPQAKELLVDIERSFQRLAEIARCSDEFGRDKKYDRPFAFFGLFRGE